MSTLSPSVSSLSRAILRCEIGIAENRLTLAQVAALENRQHFKSMSALMPIFSTSTLESREYIIIPVVACIGDRVAHPTSEANLDELIPSTVLGDVPSQWDGRPIILDHPPLSEDANTPKSYQSRKFGLMFDTTYDFDTNKLTTNAWIDYERAKEVGADYLIDKIVSGDITEVSIGVLRQLILQKGEHNGQPYQAIWVKMVSDHLAFLHSDQIGACSVDVGCGAGRLGIDTKASKEGTHMPNNEDTKTEPSTTDLPLTSAAPKGLSIGGLFQRFKSLFSLPNLSTSSDKSNAESSLQQTKHTLYQVLFDRIPGLMDVFDILPESSICLFETYRIETGYEQWAIRYQVTGDVVSIAEGEQPIKVMPKTVWVSVESGVAVSEGKSEEAGEEAKVIKAHQCGCDKNKSQDADTKDTKATQEQEEIKIESKPESEPQLETAETAISGDKTMSEKKTEEITNTPPPAAAPVTPPIATTSNQAASASLSTPVDLEAYLSTAPPEIRRIVERDRQNELRTRNSAIESVLANQKREIWTKERLETLDTETLTTIADSLVGEDDIQAIQTLPTQQSYPNNADYSGSRSSYGASNRPADPRDNSRSLGWGGAKKEAN